MYIHLIDILFSGLADDLTYLDPSSGSILLQLIIAGLLGLGIVLRSQWSKIKRLFKRKEEDAIDIDADE
ncbi:MAG: hypothetical protein ABIJ39_09660 [Chloroflexota bacterium]